MNVRKKRGEKYRENMTGRKKELRFVNMMSNFRSEEDKMGRCEEKMMKRRRVDSWRTEVEADEGWWERRWEREKWRRKTRTEALRWEKTREGWRRHEDREVKGEKVKMGGYREEMVSMEEELEMDRGWKDAEREGEMAGPSAVNTNEEEWGDSAACWTCYWPHTHTQKVSHTLSLMYWHKIYEANK